MTANSFTVKGSGLFPMDMLSEDECWPVDTTDVLALLGKGNRSVRLRGAGHYAPSVERWERHGWSVHDIVAGGGAVFEAYKERCYEDGEVPCNDTGHHKWVISDENENHCYCEKCGCSEY